MSDEPRTLRQGMSITVFGFSPCQACHCVACDEGWEYELCTCLNDHTCGYVRPSAEEPER